MTYKSCPFCGSDSIDVRANFGMYGAYVYAACQVCGSRGKTFLNKKHWDDDDFWDDISVKSAENAWNMRAGDSGAQQTS